MPYNCCVWSVEDGLPLFGQSQLAVYSHAKHEYYFVEDGGIVTYPLWRRRISLAESLNLPKYFDNQLSL